MIGSELLPIFWWRTFLQTTNYVNLVVLIFFLPTRILSCFLLLYFLFDSIFIVSNYSFDHILLNTVFRIFFFASPFLWSIHFSCCFAYNWNICFTEILGDYCERWVDILASLLLDPLTEHVAPPPECNAVTYRATGLEAVFYIYFGLLEHN